MYKFVQILFLIEVTDKDNIENSWKNNEEKIENKDAIEIEEKKLRN